MHGPRPSCTGSTVLMAQKEDPPAAAAPIQADGQLAAPDVPFSATDTPSRTDVRLASSERP
jgi:hypothetical protein